MVKEAYVSFEVAKLLKEKGFDEPTRMVWYEHLPKENACHPTEIYKPKLDLYYHDAQTEREMKFSNSMPVDEYIYGDVFATPTHQMAMAWLREKQIDIVVFHERLPKDCYWARIERYPYTEHQQEPIYQTYEEAVETALKYSLENLI